MTEPGQKAGGNGRKTGFQRQTYVGEGGARWHRWVSTWTVDLSVEAQMVPLDQVVTFMRGYDLSGSNSRMFKNGIEFIANAVEQEFKG